MITGFVDTNIIVEIFRGNKIAKAWYEAHPDLAISSVAWLELLAGASGRSGQNRCLEIIAPLDIVFLTDSDQQWAMKQILHYRLSHGLSLKDSLIASVCYRLQVPLYTQNVKDFVFTLGPEMAIKPY
jgi:predicted nucleic acid-binding protein